MAAASTATYPEWEEIPPATPSPSVRRRPIIPMPDVVRRLFAQFPWYTWPAAHVVASKAEAEPSPTNPVLYITPPLDNVSSSWASADPVSLRWQMEFLLRDVPFECKSVHDAYWSPEHATPFLQMPEAMQKAENGRIVMPPVLGATYLPHFMDNYYPLTRPESKEKPVWPGTTGNEALVWQSLLEGRIMAGVVLASLRAGAYTPPPASVPLLRRWFGAYLPGERAPEQAAYAKLARLSTAGASPSSLAAVYGSDYVADMRNPLTLVPGYSVDWVGFVSGTSTHQTTDMADVDALPPSLRLDQAAILRDAAEALESVAQRLASDVDASTGEGWMLGAAQATSLDALLFAILHTLACLPSTVTGPLTPVLQRHAVLDAYRRRLHTYLP